MSRPDARGRGSQINPPNRFESVHHEDDFEHLEYDTEYFEGLRSLPTEYIPDHSRTIVSENDSPDIPFRYSINPYRGCSHGCVYCYARPGHEYLSFNAGLDFETKIMVKHKAADLFRDFLARDSWKPEMIAFSGVTDCYQPAERQFRLTRACLEVALEARQPIGIVTKNSLVLRDLDLLQEMAKFQTVRVFLSVTTLDQELTKHMEPRTSAPAARLRAIAELRKANVPVGVMVAPVIPGLNDHEIPNLLQAASEAGAMGAGKILLRLPLTVLPVFQDWLERNRPQEKERILSRVRATREGKLNGSEFGSRMTGSGEIAEQITQVFQIFAKKYRLDKKFPPYDTSHFRPPRTSSGEMRLF